MKTKTIIALFLFISFAVKSQSLEIVLSIDKTEYLESEPIYILAEVKNTGTQDIVIPPISLHHSSSGIDIILKNSSGEILHPLNNYHIYENYPMKLIKLHPGESAITLYDINDVFANNDYTDKSNISLWNMFLISNDYTIQLKYNFIEFGLSPDVYTTSEFLSNIIKFKIVKPYLMKDIIVYNLLSEAKQFYITRDYHSYIDKLIFIVENYYESSYALLAYKYLISMDIIVKNIDYAKYREKLCMDFPNSIMVLASAMKLLKEDPVFKTKITSAILLNLVEKFNNYYQKFK